MLCIKKVRVTKLTEIENINTLKCSISVADNFRFGSYLNGYTADFLSGMGFFFANRLVQSVFDF